MKKNRVVIFFIVAIILVGIAFGCYQYYFKEDSNSTLTLVEKQWIESNKNKVIDLGVSSAIPVFTKDGEGVFFDFLTDIEKDTKLEFNKIAFKPGEKSDTAYTFQVVDRARKQDILLYQDNYALLSNIKATYYKASELRNLKIGVLKDDVDAVNHALAAGNNLIYQSFDTVDALLAAVTKDKSGKAVVDAIVLPKMFYLSEIGAHDNLHISYNINEMTKDYVFTLGKTKRLNTIINKYYTKWQREHYQTSFNKNFSNIYFVAKQIDEQAKSTFHSKRYVYGFVKSRPYHATIDGKLYGYNMKQIKNFASMAGIEVAYQEYPSYAALQEALSANKVDLFYQMTAPQTYRIETTETTGMEQATIVIASPVNRSVVVNSLSSLRDKTVAVVKDSNLAQVLKKAGAKLKTYQTLDELIDNKDKTQLLALDYYSFEYYRHNQLQDYSVDYMGAIGSYSYLIRDVKGNQVLANYFDFYLSMVNDHGTVNDSIYTLLQIGNKPYIIKSLMILISAVVIVLLGYLGIKKYQQVRDRASTVSKTDKLRYIDSLTSLKNRTYLNDHIEAWDNSEVYPQAIIIVDLNNVAYINDNYGHQEGDVIIKEAANKLIKTQIENSDIIRTNGNEFLIYLVGYDEKQIITYIRKLNKEFKDLSHGYGAAIGYSMIIDAIKTIDDAVNEATLDMRNNKEELNN